MKRSASRRGSALLIAVVIVIMLVGVGGAFLSMTLSQGSRQFSSMRADEAQVICDAGLEMARLSLKEWRNADPLSGDLNPADYAWNQIFQYCVDVDAKSPGMGTTADPMKIGNDARAKYASGALLVADTSGSTVPLTFQELFCVQRPYGKGVYYLVLRNNKDIHGNGVDDDLDGDPWNPDTPAELAAALSSPVIDGDRKAQLIITATLRDGTVRQIEALVEYPERKFSPAAALLDNGTIRMNGSFQVMGTKGIVQANEDVVGNGGNAVVEVSVNASGSSSGFSMNNPPPGGINSGVTPATIPKIDNVMDLLKSPELAPYLNDIVIFDSKGNATNVAGTGVGVASNYGFALKNGEFTMSGGGSAPPAKIYFFDGDVKMTGQGNALPYNMSIITTGSVSLAGNVAFSAFSKTDGSGNLLQTNTLIVAGKDLDLGGTGGLNLANPQYAGSAYAVEQIKIHGNFTLKGAVIGENLRDSTGSLITTSSQVEPDATVIGNPTIAYNGGGTFLPNPAQSVVVRSVRQTK